MIIIICESHYLIPHGIIFAISVRNSLKQVDVARAFCLDPPLSSTCQCFHTWGFLHVVTCLLIALRPFMNYSEVVPIHGVNIDHGFNRVFWVFLAVHHEYAASQGNKWGIAGIRHFEGQGQASPSERGKQQQQLVGKMASELWHWVYYYDHKTCFTNVLPSSSHLYLNSYLQTKFFLGRFIIIIFF